MKISGMLTGLLSASGSQPGKCGIEMPLIIPAGNTGIQIPGMENNGSPVYKMRKGPASKHHPGNVSE
jgi:hypothetical protein